jgi:hypothetical protein
MVPFSFAGETFYATGSAALFWRARQALLVAFAAVGAVATVAFSRHVWIA